MPLTLQQRRIAPSKLVRCAIETCAPVSQWVAAVLRGGAFFTYLSNQRTISYSNCS
jgi:hypothetical protein